MDLTPLTTAYEDESLALIRTDRHHDAAWDAILDALRAPIDLVGDGHLDDPPDLLVLDSPSFDGATPEMLAVAALADGDTSFGYALLADSQSMVEAEGGDETTLVYVDLSCPDEEEAADFGTFMGRSFRCVIPEIASIHVNLALANLDFRDFADYADDRGGVFRGFEAGD